MAEQLVRYDNRMNTLSLHEFTEREMNLFFAIVAKVKGKDDQEVEFTFDQLYRMTDNKKNITSGEFKHELISMNEKLMSLKYRYNIGSKSGIFILFPGFEVDEAAETLKVQVNKKFTYLFNHLNAEFTQFELREFVGLKGKYTKQLYRQLKQWRQVGTYSVPWDEFKQVMDIPNYKTRDIAKRVLDPSVNRINKLPGFADLRYEYSTRKKKVVRIVFHWTVVPDDYTRKYLGAYEGYEDEDPEEKTVRMTDASGAEYDQAALDLGDELPFYGGEKNND